MRSGSAGTRARGLDTGAGAAAAFQWSLGRGTIGLGIAYFLV